MRSYFVYILRCSDGSYYTGITNDYLLRFEQHQDGQDTLCYTYTRRPVRLVYVAEFWDVHQAIDWEKRVKRWSRKKKEALIHGDFDLLPNLSKSAYARRIDATAGMTAQTIRMTCHGSTSSP